MNIYIDVEISSRELDAKLLLAVLAASKGHKVIVSHLTEIMLGIKSGSLAPGIFHTTSLAPSSEKIRRHKLITQKGFVITSFDEEGGLIDEGYDKFSKIRYSEQTLDQSTAVFGWGNEDSETLKKVYPNQSHKIYNTGSPRSDLWRSVFNSYWRIPNNIPKRPYLLVSSNMFSVSRFRPFYQNIKHLKNMGFFERDKEFFFDQFKMESEDILKTLSFTNAIKYLARNSNGFDIVLRPHPVENIEAWKVFLEDIPNVHVIKNHSITPWIINSFAIMHNSCTSAIEATISGKPVVTYLPFEQNYHREIPNKLGHKVDTLEKLSQTVNNLFNERDEEGQKQLKTKIPDIISKKIYIDPNQLSAEKVIKVWEQIEAKNLSKKNNLIKLKLLLKISNLRVKGGEIKKKMFSSRFGIFKENYKFPLIEKNDIYLRVKKLQSILKIEKKINCKILSNRTILIEKN